MRNEPIRPIEFLMVCVATLTVLAATIAADLHQREQLRVGTMKSVPDYTPAMPGLDERLPIAGH